MRPIGSAAMIAQIGSGGMGVVHRARQLLVDRSVALKILPRDLADDTAAAKRLTHEANAISQLRRPASCRVLIERLDAIAAGEPDTAHGIDAPCLLPVDDTDASNLLGECETTPVPAPWLALGIGTAAADLTPLLAEAVRDAERLVLASQDGLWRVARMPAAPQP